MCTDHFYFGTNLNTGPRTRTTSEMQLQDGRKRTNRLNTGATLQLGRYLGQTGWSGAGKGFLNFLLPWPHFYYSTTIQGKDVLCHLAWQRLAHCLPMSSGIYFVPTETQLCGCETLPPMSLCLCRNAEPLAVGNASWQVQKPYVARLPTLIGWVSWGTHQAQLYVVAQRNRLAIILRNLYRSFT